MPLIRNNKILMILLGMIGGYLILHPYTMIVYYLVNIHRDKKIEFHWNQFMQKVALFDPTMLPMAISFIIFGGLIGLFIAIVIDRRKKLLDSEYEIKKNKIAVEILKELMVTLSHHLLNANMIIGGKVRHCRKYTKNKHISESLDVIEEEGRKIDAVIRSLREVTEIKTADYTTSGTVGMIDIEKEIEERLGEDQK